MSHTMSGRVTRPLAIIDSEWTCGAPDQARDLCSLCMQASRTGRNKP